MENPLITIFSPTYNAENFLPYVFSTLEKQAYKNFEWLIVDDCSTDNTVGLLKELQKSASFPIRIIQNETNQMVTKNIETGIHNANGKFLYLTGHDDGLKDDCLSTFVEDWNSLDAATQDNICGLVYHCEDQNGNFIGTEYPFNYWISNDFEMRFKYNVKGEKSSFHKVELLKTIQYAYPEIDVYIPENLFWFELSYQYNFMYINKVMRIYFQHDTHDNISKSIGPGKKYMAGFSFFFHEIIRKYNLYLKKNYFKIWLVFQFNYIRYSRYNLQSYKEIIQRAENKNLIVLLIPFAMMYELIKFRRFI
ncbi:glycosyltransferase family 2 protein [Epilithonimonas arachidiradicis]|uniref:Beta-glycosyltransferase n=1 Tax=Epilithonimonas arachidiradicis TaxID=1617282 RepID=A0A420DDJ3_9FLAO|nr:glycosyltransferase family 2 protein [Epilithonimonas arachidiradicis]RKE89894.1 glycosyltransferase involved in cell wall biosynthesis [Epilithonimonas arachidiradicis]GGG46135.1 beta-glycosyltransferase [Epilithonimonas arachidiradicis]